MAMRKILIFVTFAALVIASEVEDGEQKKRGAGKASSLNAIPTGAQKSEYTYSIYSQSPNSQSPSSQPYQSQVPSSFYPTQSASQYYSNSPPDATSSYSSSYSQQPQLNLIPPSTSSQFIPLNFGANPGFQSKIQIIPSKTANGNVQLAIIQQPPFQSLSYPQALFSPNPNNQVNHQQNSLLGPLSQGHFAQNYQPLSLGSPYLNQPSTMLLVAQPNPSLYNNLLYPNPVQSFYNYYPTNSQAKYNYGVPQQSTNEYDKIQPPVSQSISKDDNDIGVHSEYTAPSDSSNYKNAYSASRTYTKLK